MYSIFQYFNMYTNITISISIFIFIFHITHQNETKAHNTNNTICHSLRINTNNITSIQVKLTANKNISDKMLYLLQHLLFLQKDNKKRDL